MLTKLSVTLLHIHEHAASGGNFVQTLPSILCNVLENTLEITCLVILMMTLIELINVSSSGKLMTRLRNYPILQTVIAGLLGVIPGCAGGFAVVSMFTHGMITFGALMGGMIATFGDEAFFLFAKSPKWGLILTAILFALGLLVGVMLNFASRKWNLSIESHEFEIHEEIVQHKHTRAEGGSFGNHVIHFFKEHLWEHVVKKHLLSIFLWSFGVLLFLQVLEYFLDIETLLQTHQWAKYLLLLLAVLIGFIPESGPHLVFILMFLEGTIPFGILLANSIAQNGHAGLPLLAQSRKNFFIMKSFTMLLGLICGAILI